ncbi:uncharacterized protein zmp:0000000991 isoform X2 [Neoarius graeffei]|uniref:uncharacterized protein zmp:0000000991 isoform X2 n=1 Tax=Neoarius graeffei TaxID=443677 RepID=UPI00298CFB45|nr:uncharacterized protein zmp:0000000991 isoform X2 [Neoarius graeffei]
MSFASSVKSKCSQGKVNTERGSAPVENSSTQREKAGGFQDARGKKCITSASTECVQTTKNLHTRRRTVLKSKGEWVSTAENQDEHRGQPRFTSFFSLRFPSTKRDSYRTNTRVATKLRNTDLYINEWKLVGTRNSSVLQKDKQQVPSAHDPQEFSQLMFPV